MYWDLKLALIYPTKNQALELALLLHHNEFAPKTLYYEYSLATIFGYPTDPCDY